MKFPFGVSLRILAVVCMVSIGFLGCSKNTEVTSETRPPTSEQDSRTWIQSMADLRRVLAPGMSTNELMAQWGRPDRVDNATEGVVWKYSVRPFPADGQMSGAYVLGVVIGVTNGRVAEWGCAYRGPPMWSGHVVREESLSLKGQDTGAPTLKFHVVSSEPVANGRFVDTKQLPKLGYIAATPSLVVSKLREVMLAERKASDAPDRSTWSFRISLLPEDATGLESITTTNLGELMLITVGDEPIMAPRIMAALQTGSFEIDCSERSLMEVVKQQLEKMRRQ